MATSLAVTNTLPLEPTLQMKLQLPHPPSKGVSQNNSSRMKQRLRLDPSRALEPARKKVSTVEAQRVMSVFEEAIRKTEIVTLLPFILENIDRFRIVLGTDLCGMLEQHAATEESYEEIKQQLDTTSRQMPRRNETADQTGSEMGENITEESGYDYPDEERSQGDDDRRERFDSARSDFSHASSGDRSIRSSSSYDSHTDKIMNNLSFVAQQLSSSCKNILRAFGANPTAMTTIRAEVGRRSQECESFVVSMQELKEVLLHKLLTTPEEAKERMAYLHEISLRERNNATVIEKLDTELKAGIDDKEEEIRKKNDIIRKLQADLHQIEKFSEEHIRRVKGEAEKQEAADIKNSDGKKQKLVQEMSQLKTQLQNLVVEHRDNEQEMRRKKFKIETEVENWIQKYDQEMGQRQDEYEEIDAIYTEEKKQLNELEERFKTLEGEYQQIMEERRIAREQREAAEREMALMVKSATTIQAFWRSYKVRKALKARKKKKGGKGKGKGKKK